jgi:hypothetical protein
MIETINDMTVRFPNQKNFVVAGTNHFTNSTVQDHLRDQPYIVLNSKYNPGEKDAAHYNKVINEYAREYMSTDQSANRAP